MIRPITRPQATIRPDPAHHPGRHDGERVRDAALAQPISAASSLAYLGAGWWLWRQRPACTDPALMATFAVAVAANGIGGFAFHGPGDPVSRWAHDAALGSTVAVLATATPGRPGRSGPKVRQSQTALVTATAAAVAVAVAPRSTNLVTGGLGLVAARRLVQSAAHGDRPHRAAAVIAAGALAAGVAANGISHSWSEGHHQGLRATGHGWWHALTALALAAWGSAVIVDRPESSSGSVTTRR